MTTVTVTQDTAHLKAKRARLYRRCQKAHVTHDAVAAEAQCSRSYVVHFFAGRRSSRAIELAIEKLLAKSGEVD